MKMGYPYLIDFNPEELPVHYSDVLVVGGGIAGLTVALIAAERFKVRILAKTGAKQTSTWYAQGGIAASLGPGDSPELHFKDTIAAGAGLGGPAAGKVVVEEAGAAVEMLLDLGTRFDRGHGTVVFGR